MKHLIAAMALTALLSASASVAYDRDRLEQLLAVRSCESCDLKNANLVGQDLRNAELKGADLTAADLSSANLTGADLRGANLTEAILTGANMTDALLENAVLTGADLTDAYVDPAECGSGGSRVCEIFCIEGSIGTCKIF